MLEGLWVAKFVAPNVPGMELNGGVVVIESGRLLGGDSGYVYIGQLQPAQSGWAISMKIVRHDPSIISVFGDLDEYLLSGVAVKAHDQAGAEALLVQLSMAGMPIQLTVELKKVAELP